MIYDKILMVYTFMAAIFPFVACGLIALTMGKAKRTVAAISIIASLMSFIASCAISYIVLSHSGYTLHIELPWITTQEGDIPAIFTVNRISSLFMVVISLISVITQFYVVKIFKNRENDVWLKYFGITSLSQSLILLTIISSSLLQIYIFTAVLSVATFLLRAVERQHSPPDTSSIKILMINLIADSFLLAGSIIFLTGLGTADINSLYVLLSEGLLKNNHSAISATSLILCSIALKAGFYPFNAILLKNSNEYQASLSTRICFLHTAIPFFILITIKPFTILLPELYTAVFIFMALITAFMASCNASLNRRISQIAGNICFANSGFLAIALVCDAGSASFILLYTMLLIVALLLMVSGYISSIMYSDSIWDGNINNKYVRMIFSACAVSVFFLSGLPPFVGFWRNTAILASLNNSFYLLFTSLTIFILSYSSARMSSIIFLNKNGDLTPSNNPSITISVSFAILTVLSVFISLLELPFASSFWQEYTNIKTNLSVSMPDILIALSMNIWGILTGFMLYRNITERKESEIRTSISMFLKKLIPLRRIYKK